MIIVRWDLGHFRVPFRPGLSEHAHTIGESWARTRTVNIHVDGRWIVERTAALDARSLRARGRKLPSTRFQSISADTLLTLSTTSLQT